MTNEDHKDLVIRKPPDRCTVLISAITYHGEDVSPLIAEREPPNKALFSYSFLYCLISIFIQLTCLFKTFGEKMKNETSSFRSPVINKIPSSMFPSLVTQHLSSEVASTCLVE